MPEIHQRHAEAIRDKARRFADQLIANDSAGVPAALVALADAGPAGELLAENAWDLLTQGMPARINRRGEPVAEEKPSKVTRVFIASFCEAPPTVAEATRAALDRAAALRQPADPFAGLPG